jgi:hypothetical protein
MRETDEVEQPSPMKRTRFKYEQIISMLHEAERSGEKEPTKKELGFARSE